MLIVIVINNEIKPSFVCFQTGGEIFMVVIQIEFWVFVDENLWARII